MNKIAIKYALIITVASIVVKLGVYYAGLQQDEFVRLSLLIPILFLLLGLFLGIIEMRKSTNVNDEHIGFKNDVKNGIRIAVLNAIFYSIFIYLYYSQIDTGFFHFRISEGLKTLFEQGSTKGELINYYKNAHFFLNPSKQSYFTLFGYIFLGLLYSVAIAFIINTKFFKRLST